MVFIVQHSLNLDVSSKYRFAGGKMKEVILYMLVTYQRMAEQTVTVGGRQTYYINITQIDFFKDNVVFISISKQSRLTLNVVENLELPMIRRFDLIVK